MSVKGTPVIRFLVFLMLALAAAPPGGRAQENDFHARWGLPDDAMGRRLGQLLEVLSRDDEALGRDLVRNGMIPAFLEMAPVEGHLEQFEMMRGQLGAFEVDDIRLEGPYRADLVLLAETGNRFALHVELEEIEPHRLAGIGFRAYDPDLEIPEFADLEEVDHFLSGLAGAGKFSGVVLVERRGEPRFARAYGMANKEKKIPNTLDTRFNVGSITKSFTAVATMQLVEEGKIGLDDPMGKYLTGFPPEIASRVTVRHLLSMTSGYGDYFDAEKFREQRSRIRTIDDYLDIFRGFSLDFEPGTDRQYSNTGYTLLGGIIEAASGMSYFDYVQTHVFEAAGMTGSSFPQYSVDDDRVAMGYTNDLGSDDYGDTNLEFCAVRGNPSGGSFSTAEDLVRFNRALRADELLNEADTTLLLNFFEKGKPRPARRGTAGGAPGVSAVNLEDAAKGITVIVLSNYDEPLGEKVGQAISNMLERE